MSESSSDIEDRLMTILECDDRFPLSAYLFVLQGLEETRQKLSRADHVSGPELVRGILSYGIDRFGPLALTVFESWGIRRTREFGLIVLNLSGAGILSIRPEDTLDSFTGVFDLADAFERELARRRTW